MSNSKKIKDEDIIEFCKNSLSMSSACAKLGLHFNTFKRRAIKLKCYKPNKSGKGIKKLRKTGKFSLQNILEGEYPEYQTNKLKLRLIKEEIIKNKCFKCDITEWQGEPLVLELNHIDGNRHNHNLNNLQLLCPNCHSQTKNFRGKNKKNME
jgi:Zn finger protein HypA/HybF involved in hydrogenase expression